MHRRLSLLAMVLAAALLAACGGGGSGDDRTEQCREGAAAQTEMPRGFSQTGQSWIVVLHESVDVAGFADLARNRGLSVRFTYNSALKGLAVSGPRTVIDQLRTNPSVASIERDRTVTTFQDPCPGDGNGDGGDDGGDGGGDGGGDDGGNGDDGGGNGDDGNGGGDGGSGDGGSGEADPPDRSHPDQPDQTVPSGVERIGADENSNTGAGTGVAVLDTGIVLDHPDLEPNIAGGISFVGDWAMDENGHGTHVAGTIAARDNGVGVVGVAPEASLYAVKVMGEDGTGPLSAVIKGIDWSAERSGEIGVINMSLGLTGESDALREAVQGARGNGLVPVAAAGNRYENASDTIPAAYSATIAASGINQNNDAFAHFSNYGTGVIDTAGPAVSVRSTHLSGETGADYYKRLSGTSMATPHIAGAAALYLSSNPGASPDEVQTAIDNSGFVPSFGWGDDPTRVGFRPDPDDTTEELVIAEDL